MKTQSEVREMIRRYKAGETSIQIAKDINCHHATVLQYLRRAGVGTKYKANRK